jgi:prepilin-type N-terminal cleavage/methylation domain-containing protein
MMRRAVGFTLIEMVIVIVLMGIASAAVVTMVAQVASGQSENTELQVGAQLLQECGEYLVANHRRDENFFPDTLTVGTSVNCFSGSTAYDPDGTGSIPAFSAVSVTITDVTGNPECPPNVVTSPVECKNARLSLTNGNVTLNPVNVLLVKYN